MSSTEPPKRTSKQVEPVVLFSIADSTFAIPASAVEEIRNLDGLEPCTLSSPYSNLHKVRFTFERDKKTYLVVDLNMHFQMLPSPATRLLVLRELPIALLVDGIDRMCELTAVRKLPQAFTGDEKLWYRGLTVVKNQLIPLINIHGFLSKAEATVAQAEVLRARASRESAKSTFAGGGAASA